MNQLKDCLNEAQFDAVTTIEGPVLVIAGAGAGKTRVIEYRVLHLVQSNIPPSSVLLLTFTRRAARQMLSRAARHDPRCSSVEGGTFHSFAYRTLKKYARAIGFADSFSVLDEGDAEEAIHRCSNMLGFFEREKRFPRKDTLRNIISVSVNKNASVSEVLQKEYPHFLEYGADIEALRKRYAEYKIERNYLDYDDLLLYMRLLLEDERVRSRLAEKYQYIMVDEFQDTNGLQGDLTYLLAEKHRNVMVVGDDAQSIYGFRGASFENIMKFPEHFPGCKVVKLEENYRSTQSILDVANSVIANMKHKYSKYLLAARKKKGGKPRLLFFKDAYEEAEWIAEKIKTLRDEGTTLGHQGVLFRSSYISIPLQAELGKRNIPYQLFGGLKFYETAHVKDVMAHLKILVNPHDELAWNRVFMLIDGVGPKTCDGLLKRTLACSHLEDILTKVLGDAPYRKRQESQGFARLKDALSAAQNAKMSTGERYALIFDYYKPILKDRFDNWHLRINDLETLEQISMRYGSIEDLLTDFAIEPPERGVWRVDPSEPDEERPLTLSTVHSAKGLEWECVFVIGLMDGVLPVSFALRDPEDTEEEQRLFYVAITRAKNELFLSLHHQGTRGGITQFNKISRFVDVTNVLSNLDRSGVTGFKAEQIARPETPEKIVPIYDKESLLKKLEQFLR